MPPINPFNIMFKLVSYTSDFHFPKQVIEQKGSGFNLLHIWLEIIPDCIKSIDEQINRDIEYLRKDGLGDDSYFDVFPDMVLFKLQLEAHNAKYCMRLSEEGAIKYYDTVKADLLERIIKADKQHHLNDDWDYDTDEERLELTCYPDLSYQDALNYFETEKDDWEPETLVCIGDQAIWDKVKELTTHILQEVMPANPATSALTPERIALGYQYALESEETMIPIDHLYTLIMTAILLNEKTLYIGVFEDLMEVKLETDESFLRSDEETWHEIHQDPNKRFHINNTEVIFFYS